MGDVCELPLLFIGLRLHKYSWYETEWNAKCTFIWFINVFSIEDQGKKWKRKKEFIMNVNEKYRNMVGGEGAWNSCCSFASTATMLAEPQWSWVRASTSSPNQNYPKIIHGRDARITRTHTHSLAKFRRLRCGSGDDDECALAWDLCVYLLKQKNANKMREKNIAYTL